MNSAVKNSTIGFCLISLCSCSSLYEDNFDSNYRAYTYDNSQIYPQVYYPSDNNAVQNISNTAVSVPDSYHVGASHAPVSFKDRDKNWVSSQNPQGYTIEVAEDEKASQVAKTLFKTPKNDRMAQVKYVRNGKSYYKGVYGTYDSPEAAQKALNSLPIEIKQKAGVKSWGSVQNNLE